MAEQTLITQYGSQFLRGLFRLVRNSFRTAGQDSFTEPPMQSPDMFEELLNVVPPVQGDIDRRWGYRVQTPGVFTSLSALAKPGTQNLYQNSLTGARQLVYSADSQPIVATTEDGQITRSAVFTPSSSQPMRMLNSRSYGYFANGATPDYKKWDGSAGVSTWGIDINNVSGAMSGPTTPTVVNDLGDSGNTGAQVQPTHTAISVTRGQQPWSSPSWAISLDGLLTYAQLQGEFGGTFLESDWLEASNFGFSIPLTATVTGVQVDVYKRAIGAISDLDIRLIQGGVPAGINHSIAGNWPDTTTDTTYGGPSDLWGLTITPAHVNSPAFGVAIAAQVTASQPANFAEIDYIQILVYFEVPVTSSWTLPNNIKLEDAAVATAEVTTSYTSSLQTGTFGFAVGATNVIEGIQVKIKASALAPTSNLEVELVKAGLGYGNRKLVNVTSTGLAYYTFGGPQDLWGGSWTVADVNAAGFGTQFRAISFSGTTTLSVDVVSITVYSAVGPLALSAPAAGAVSLSVGRTYTYAFKNSVTGHLSDISPFSASTGPLTLQQQPLTNFVASNDSQVDTKILLATADGGDQTTLYFVAELPNATTTYTDVMPEETLLLQNIYLNQDTTGTILGIADNSPPPVGSVNPVYHRGRVYMTTPSNLYYSKAEGDLLTSSGTLTGKYEEAWPNLNYFPIAEGAEVNRGLLSDGQVLYIGTDKRIVRLFGDGPSTYTKPESLFLHTGIANQDVWKIVFVEGNPLGAMWLTPDRRVLGSDFNTYQDIGLPIQDVLDSVNRAAYQQTSWASYVGISNWNLYILAIPTGSASQPNTLCIFDLKSKMWYIWQPTDQMLSGQYNITIGGQPQFVTLAQSGTAYAWDPSLLQDRVGNTPVNFPVTIRTTWQDFTDPAARKFLNELEVITGDASLRVTVEGASTKDDFTNPHVVVSSAPLRAKPRGEYFLPLAALTTKDRYYRFTFTSTGSGTDILRGWNVQGGIIHRL